MAETDRIRAKPVGSASGRRRRWTSGVLTVDETRTGTWYTTCKDNVGYYPLPGPLQITKVNKGGIATLTGENIAGAFRTLFEGCPSTWHETASLSHVSLPWQSESADATKAMDRTNPSKPIVDLPVFYSEMRELPSMIKHSGNNLWDSLRLPDRTAKSLSLKMAQFSIQWSFGWKPLLRDLLGLYQFQQAYNKRAMEVAKIYEKGGLRRRITLDRLNKTDFTPSLTVNSVLAVVTCSQNRVTQGLRWATVRWRPLEPTVSYDLKTGRRMVKRIQSLLSLRSVTLGLALGLATLWEALPWTWLIDWFTNVGTWFGAHRNGVPCYMSRCCVMTQTVTRYLLGRLPGNSWLGGGGGNAVYETKQRSIHYTPTPTATIPFLSWNQLSILLSLSVIKSRRVHL